MDLDHYHRGESEVAEDVANGEMWTVVEGHSDLANDDVYERVVRTFVEALPPDFAPGRFYVADDGRRSLLICGKKWRQEPEQWEIFVEDHQEWGPIEHRCAQIEGGGHGERHDTLRSALEDLSFDFESAYWASGGLLACEFVRPAEWRMAICYQRGAPNLPFSFTACNTELRVRALERIDGVRLVVAAEVIAGRHLSMLKRRVAYVSREFKEQFMENKSATQDDASSPND